MSVEQESRAALVTGASRGIGKEIALELARKGWRVAVRGPLGRARARPTGAQRDVR